MKIKKCECGSTDFIIREILFHEASLSEDGQLTVYKADGEIDIIECSDCGQKYREEDFSQINFQ